MTTERLLTVAVVDQPATSTVAWAEGMTFRLPAALLDGDTTVRGHLTGLAEALRLRSAFTDQPPLASRLPLSYCIVPGTLRSLIARTIGRWHRGRKDRWAAFPSWPLDLSADFLTDLASAAPSPFAEGPTPVLLTHDLDSSEGLHNLVHTFLEIEEDVGARSTNFVVPCGWPLDHAQLTEVQVRGHALGIHGYDHANRTPFADAPTRRFRLDAARAPVDRYGMEGYRAPGLLRTRKLLRDLGRIYRFDSSIPTSGGLFPVPNNGCASARPFRVEGIAEVPLSLPRDGSLLFLGHRPVEIGDLWIRCAERIALSGGVVVLLTHCEARFSGNRAMQAAYRGFLEHITASDRFRWSTFDEVLCQAFEPAVVAEGCV